jgi:DNA-binding MarR family transcriptional regulator
VYNNCRHKKFPPLTEYHRGMTRWLDEEEMRAWRGLVDVQSDVMAALEAELMERHGLSGGEYGVLVTLSEAPDHRMRMCDLAGRGHLSPSGLTRLVDRLVKEGLVGRRPADDDRRVTMAGLTPQGLARLEAAAPEHVGGVRRHFMDHLSRAQIRQLGNALSAVAQHRAERRSTD